MKSRNFMNFIELKKTGSAENLIIQKGEIPEINEYEVLLEVYASGVNRPDVLQRKGLYAPPPGASEVLGLEVAGKIKKIGKKVKNFKINQRVCALVHGGGYAEYCKVFYKHVLPIPKGMNFIEAATIPENFFTVWYNLFEIGKIKNNQTILIHGGSSGIGTVAKNRDKLGVFSCFEDYAYCLIYVSDDVLFLILPHHLADVLPKCYPKLLSKVVQILTNQVGKNG